ncbi:unnamed protein product [Pleuronectes platessa]|uniref:Uncharacterized protein n=1 Tax=Pleuronectes platessa TaxID=8262 RepID=A0A9N7U322_PLEPL|nr:unnamed protein product [Pleuronectes platessa]
MAATSEEVRPCSGHELTTAVTSTREGTAQGRRGRRRESERPQRNPDTSRESTKAHVPTISAVAFTTGVKQPSAFSRQPRSTPSFAPLHQRLKGGGDAIEARDMNPRRRDKNRAFTPFHRKDPFLAPSNPGCYGLLGSMVDSRLWEPSPRRSPDISHRSFLFQGHRDREPFHPSDAAHPHQTPHPLLPLDLDSVTVALQTVWGQRAAPDPGISPACLLSSGGLCRSRPLTPADLQGLPQQVPDQRPPPPRTTLVKKQSLT